jgi:DNA repair ATPase RecN
MSISEESREVEQTALTQSDVSATTPMSELQKSGFKLQLVEKLTEIGRHYQEGVFEYKESIHAYNIEIEKLKNNIATQSASCDIEEKNLLMIEHELLFENRAYDKLQVKCTGFLNSIEELQTEYKDILDEAHYNVTLKRKEKELFDCLDDIELSEISLLKKELERLNFLESFEPKQLELKRLELALKELEMEKNYFESMGLHKVSTVQLENKNFWSENPSEIVDTVEIESTEERD